LATHQTQNYRMNAGFSFNHCRRLLDKNLSSGWALASFRTWSNLDTGKLLPLNSNGPKPLSDPQGMYISTLVITGTIRMAILFEHITGRNTLVRLYHTQDLHGGHLGHYYAEHWVLGIKGAAEGTEPRTRASTTTMTTT